MKKEFMEPEMKRIELNLKERIAASPGDEQISTILGSVRTRQFEENCTTLYVESTNYGPTGAGATADMLNAPEDQKGLLASCVITPEAANALHS